MRTLFVETVGCWRQAAVLRLRMLAFLNANGPATATHLAAALGESTTSTSYHLAQLAKHGLIEPAPHAGRGRERPWRAHARGISLESTGPPELTAAARPLRSRYLEARQEVLDGFLAREDAEDPTWREAAFQTDDLGWLTPAELDDLYRAVTALLARFRRDDPAERPAGARLVAFFAYAVPTSDPPPSATGRGSVRRLLAFGDLRLLLVGQTFSLFGDTAMRLVLGLWARALLGMLLAGGGISYLVSCAHDGQRRRR